MADANVFDIFLRLFARFLGEYLIFASDGINVPQLLLSARLEVQLELGLEKATMYPPLHNSGLDVGVVNPVERVWDNILLLFFVSLVFVSVCTVVSLIY